MAIFISIQIKILIRYHVKYCHAEIDILLLKCETIDFYVTIIQKHNLL